MKLEVPYYSQFIDVEDHFWMIRACGAACLKMAAEFHGREVPDLLALCNEAKERGGYDMANGWVHDYILMKAMELGLKATRREGLDDVDEILASLEAGNPVIVSVEKRVLEQTRFHLITLVGYETGRPDYATKYPLHADHFYYHESESTDKSKGEYRRCTAAELKDFWRGKAIFISK